MHVHVFSPEEKNTNVPLPPSSILEAELVSIQRALQEIHHEPSAEKLGSLFSYTLSHSISHPNGSEVMLTSVEMKSCRQWTGKLPSSLHIYATWWGKTQHSSSGVFFKEGKFVTVGFITEVFHKEKHLLSGVIVVSQVNMVVNLTRQEQVNITRLKMHNFPC